MGATLLPWEDYGKNRKRIFAVPPANRVYRTLGEEPKVLFEFTEGFVQVKKETRPVSFYETKVTDIPPWKKVLSATLKIPGEIEMYLPTTEI
ncbi:hypothetical protein BBP40_004153 [Aspergillus hancockii]|nr:hypothetical protein BBP40_004153 [Aspergillus hancockii]